jgi:hypothetical protein
LQERVYGAVPPPAIGSSFNRYSAGSRSDPGVWPVNWNRTFHLAPAPGAASRGAALLLHGLTDSPYSLRSIGRAPRRARLRGRRAAAARARHGALGPAQLRVEDMQAAVRSRCATCARVAVRTGRCTRRLLERRGAGRRLHAGGTRRRSAADAGRPRADLARDRRSRSFAAVVGRTQDGALLVPGFERAAWEVIGTEFDPYKYTSFSFTRPARRSASRAGDAASSGAPTAQPLRGFPPVLAFLSTVDSTVKAEAVTDALLERLAPDGHELVLFDVNRYADVQPLLVTDPGPLTQRLRARRSGRTP